jgi:hypothetical protein
LNNYLNHKKLKIKESRTDGQNKKNIEERDDVINQMDASNLKYRNSNYEDYSYNGKK